MKNYYLLFLLLLATSTSFAADITVTSNGDAGAGSLRAAIATATTGDNIFFSSSLSNQTITLSSTLTIPVGKNLTIDGLAATGLTISGNNAVRIFLLGSTSAQPTTLTLKNLRLINGSTLQNGAAVLAEHQGVLNISNCVFTGNNARLGGSAIFSAFEGSSTILNCTFNNNVSTAGNSESGSTVFLFGPNAQTVKNSTFTNNQGINGAAIHGLNAPLLIEDCNFIGNVTTAAVFDTGQPQDFLRGFGGALYVDRASQGPPSTALGAIILRRCKFENNKGRSDGGAAYIYTDPTDNVLVENCYFNDNETLGLPGSSNPNSSSGGALSQMNDSRNNGFVLRNTTFSNNKAIEGAGAVRVFWADTKIENCTFFNNQSTLIASNGYGSNGGALALSNMGGSNVEITNSTFAENSAGWVGGAIIGPASVKLKNNIFLNNTTYTFGNSGYKLALHTSNEMADLGGNIQFPAQPHPGDSNDSNVSSSVTIANANLQPLANNGGFAPTMALPAGSPAINVGGNCTLLLDQRGASRFGACDAGAFEFAGTLPVTITNFSVKPDGNSAKIEWTTASELNNSHFIISRSTDGRSFVKIDSVTTKGNGNGLNKYFAYDRRPANGVNYYKLVQFDTDGTATEIGIKDFSFGINNSQLMVYPNPTVDGKITVIIPSELDGQNKQISLINIVGKVVKKVDVNSTTQSYVFDLTGTPQGVYFISVNAGDKKFLSKIIVN